jgi:hypothetical protein
VIVSSSSFFVNGLEQALADIDSLRDFLHAYSIANPERMRSVHNFMATSQEFAGRNRPSKEVMDATIALGDRIKEELLPAKTHA